jgi:translation elongation factor EF-Tu-like GTPase
MMNGEERNTEGVSAVVNAEVTFLSEADGGRNAMPHFNPPTPYRPHIVIQDSTIRAATYDERGMGNEHYLAVEFIGGPDSSTPGTSSKVAMLLSYFPRVDYAAVQDGATFTIREGSRIVGFGVVESRKHTGQNA